jgi:hypothetical protein
VRLLKQLYSFRGCIDEAYQAHDDEHAQFHLNEACNSFSDLMHLQEPSATIPNVLSNPKFMEKSPAFEEFGPILMQQLYEGRGPPIVPRVKPEPPKNHYLPHKALDHQNQRSNVTYDIDSVCLFPTSLALAQQGLCWQPIPHPIMNITTNVHFTLPVDSYNDDSELVQVQKPLHKIPHRCLYEIDGFKALHLFVFPPKLALHLDRTTMLLTDKQQSLWVDGALC